MTEEELKQVLIQHAVPSHYYVLGGELGQGECYGLEHGPGGWMIYYSERGQKTPLGRFDNEDLACRRFLKYMADMTGDATLTAHDQS